LAASKKSFLNQTHISDRALDGTICPSFDAEHFRMARIDSNSIHPVYGTLQVMESSRFAWQHCAISSDGDHLLGIDDGGKVTLIPWNGRGLFNHEAPSGMHLSCMCVSWCGHYMACGGWRNDEVTQELVKCVAVFR
jgi:hypothetical protein